MGNTGQRRGLPKRLDNFRNFIVSLIISLFISKPYKFDPYNNKSKRLPLDNFLMLGSRLQILLGVLILLFETAGIARGSVMLFLRLSHNRTYS